MLCGVRACEDVTYPISDCRIITTVIIKASLYLFIFTLPPFYMDRLSTLSRFKASCPFLGRTKQSTLRTLCTSTSPRFPTISLLTERAAGCPVIGPVLATRSTQIVQGYASVAGTTDVHKLHQSKGVNLASPGAMAGIEKCPHANAARAAARMAEDLAAAARKERTEKAHAKAVADAQAGVLSSTAAAAAGCPFHQAANKAVTSATATTASKPQDTSPGSFNYENFYNAELDKKHKDQSYRYFNNINRLAAKFPVAHTGDVKEEVEVWCANDYLGMGTNPAVLETQQ